MAGRKSERKEAIDYASEHLVLELAIGKKKFKFRPRMFDLDTHNLGNLSDQISPIPSEIAYVGVALAEAEKLHAEEEVIFEVWFSEKMAHYREIMGAKVTVKAVEEETMSREKNEYAKRRRELIALANTIGILKAYRNGMDAKLSLSQTISANMRLEYEGGKHPGTL